MDDWYGECLQCHSVGALWNGLFPLLFPAATTTTNTTSISHHVAGPYYCAVPHARLMEEERECEGDDHDTLRDRHDGRLAHSKARRSHHNRHTCHNHRGTEGRSMTIIVPPATVRALIVLMKNFGSRVRRVRLAVDDTRLRRKRQQR
jgi:hypothetical protein